VFLPKAHGNLSSGTGINSHLEVACLQQQAQSLGESLVCAGGIATISLVKGGAAESMGSAYCLLQALPRGTVMLMLGSWA